MARSTSRTGASREPWGLVVVLWMVFGLAPPRDAHAQTHDLEVAVKANYLNKFAPFVGWPPGAYPASTSPFNLCVVGPDPFGETLDAAARNQTVAGHPVVVRRLARLDGPMDCHLAYIRPARGQALTEMLRALAHRPVLTITDEGVAAPGAIIHFVLAQGRVRFDVDVAAAQAAGLTISSKLLGLAVSVHGAAA